MSDVVLEVSRVVSETSCSQLRVNTFHCLQARNFMRDMKEGQLAFFYHSNCKEPGVAGLMKVRRASSFGRNVPCED